MSLPSSGEIKASQMNTVAGRSATANAPLSGNSSTPQAGSLVKIYATATPAVNQSAPHRFTEFYGRSFASLTGFNVGNPSVFVSDMCSQTAPGGNTYYHDGSGTYPVANDIVYLSNSTSNPVDGGTGIQWPYFANGATPGDSPLAYFRITGSTGTVQSVTNCP